MKRVIPNDIYRGLPCSAVAVGCALGISHRNATNALLSQDLTKDGYLSLKGMNALVRANLAVKRQVTFKRGERPLLRDYAKTIKGTRAVICVLGHYIYFNGQDYHSFLWNGGDEVVSAWILEA